MMIRTSHALTLAFAFVAVWDSPVSAQSVVDSGQAKTTPWSGYWWPHKQGAIQGPLAKYDRLTGKQALQWEKQNHPANDLVPDWHGYCHAWAASSVLEREPLSSRDVRPRGSNVDPVHMSVGDQKGLLALSHADDVANSYGDRYGDGEHDDRNDLAPETLWRLLRMYVKNRGVPLIVDIDASAEVWNYPVYAYEVRHWPHDSRFSRIARLTLWMADNGVSPDFIGTQIRKQTYLFTFEMRDARIVAGTGKWVGRSIEDHIDFAWYPFAAKPENPEIQYSVVLKILGRPVSDNALTSNNRTEIAHETSESAENVETTGNVTARIEIDEHAETTVTEERPGREDAVTSAETPATRRDHGPNILDEVVIVSPMELVGLIMNRTSSFALDVTVDRFDGGTYFPGETVGVTGGSARSGYLSLLLIDTRGRPSSVLLQSGKHRVVQKDQPFSFHGRRGYTLPANTAPGTYRIKAIVTARPLLLSGMVSDGIQRQTLRLPPIQERQIRNMLKKYGQEQRMTHTQLGTQSSKQLLGAFAQDEVSFYVDSHPIDPRQQQSHPKQNAKVSSTSKTGR